MKNNKILLIILVVLLAISGYYIATKDASTLKSRAGALSDFAVEDTTTIDKIFISNSTGENVTLIKAEEGEWLVEGKHKARPESISVLMKTFARIAVQSPVSSSAFENVVKSIATQSVKVEIYQGEDAPSKVYYVGEATQNHQGTFMLLEKDGVKSSEPFVMHIPGFYGYLTTRFYSNALEWRDAAVFKYATSEIKKIEVNYFESPDQSFTIQQSGATLGMYDNNTTTLLNNIDTTKLTTYLSFFSDIYYENVVLEIEDEERDSIITSQPYFSIQVTDIFGKQNKMVGYRMPYKGNPNDVDPNGNTYEYNLDRMWGYFNDEVFVFIQYRTFDKILLPKNFFLKE